MYDVIVAGSGPAGLTAAVYARRAGKTVLVLEKETFGGQITYSPKVENFPGVLEASGSAIAEKLMEQAVSLGAEVELDTVLRAEKDDEGVLVTGEYGTYRGRTLIIAAGSRHRRLGLANENELIGRGVSYCAVCDGAFCKGRRVAVVGGGNTALQDAVLLSDCCEHVTVIQNLDFLTGEEALQKTLARRDNVTVVLGAVVDALNGTDALESLTVRTAATGETFDLPVAGVFIAVGMQPDNGPFAEVCAIDENGYVLAGEDCETGLDGVYAAGDCRTKTVRQAATACGDGAVAAIAACRYIDSLDA